MKLSRIQSVLRDAAIIGAVTLAGLLLVGVLVDVTAYAVLGIRAPAEGAQRFFEHHPTLGRFHRPLAQGDWHRYRDGTRYPVRINSHGFSDDERRVTKEKPRVALIGDSTAQFWEAPPQERGPRILSGLLGGRWEVLNFGVRGYGLDQSLLLYEEKIRPFQPDVAVIHVCVNDVWDHAFQADKPYFVLDDAAPGGIRLAGVPVKQAAPPRTEGVRWWLWRHSYSLRSLGLIRHPDMNRSYPLEEHFELRPFKRVYDAEDVRLTELTRRILRRLVAELKADGVQVLLVEMPYRPVLTEAGRRRIIRQYGDRFTFERWSDTLAGFATEDEVPILSLPRVIREQGLNPDDLFHREDQLHVNAAGGRLYAESVFRTLGELGWLNPGK